MPDTRAVSVPSWAPTDTVLSVDEFMVRVKASDCVLSMVNCNVVVTLTVVDVLPARVSVPLLSVMTTFPETVTPLGRLDTSAV